MVTRAIYKIYDAHNDFNIYFYVPDDNHPSGAAKYLENMLALANEHKSLSCAKYFILANPNAEFTRSYRYHIYTDYRYDIYLHKNNHTWQIKAYDVADNETFYKGSLEVFIGTYREPKLEIASTHRIVQKLNDIHN